MAIIVTVTTTGLHFLTCFVPQLVAMETAASFMSNLNADSCSGLVNLLEMMKIAEFEAVRSAVFAAMDVFIQIRIENPGDTVAAFHTIGVMQSDQISNFIRNNSGRARLDFATSAPAEVSRRRKTSTRSLSWNTGSTTGTKINSSGINYFSRESSLRNASAVLALGNTVEKQKETTIGAVFPLVSSEQARRPNSEAHSNNLELNEAKQEEKSETEETNGRCTCWFC